MFFGYWEIFWVTRTGTLRSICTTARTHARLEDAKKRKEKHMGNCPFYRSVIVNAGRPFSAIAALSETLTSKNSSLSHKRENAKRRGGGEGMLLPPLFSSLLGSPNSG
jgi:hypothetical protein